MEPRLAARCPRAVRLSDGKVIGDGVGRQEPCFSTHPCRCQRGRCPMSLRVDVVEGITIAVKSLRNYALRTV